MGYHVEPARALDEDDRPDPGELEIDVARERLGRAIRRTPVLESTLLNALVGSRVRFKCEMFQRGGSHKIRGALNWVIAEHDRRPLRGVVTASSGNHGAAIAIACRMVGVPAVIVMPEGSNETKRAAAQAYGAEVVSDGVDGVNREAIADDIAGRRGYRRNTADSVDGIAGIGTLGYEISAIEGAQVVFVPLGLGALLAGIAIGLKARVPEIRVVGVEPAGGDDVRRSLDAGEIVRLDGTPNTIADGARSLSPSPRTFSIIRRLVDDVVTVSEVEIAEATRLVWTRLKVVAEPTAALSFAALLAGTAHGDAVCVLSGGNVDVGSNAVAFAAPQQANLLSGATGT